MMPYLLQTTVPRRSNTMLLAHVIPPHTTTTAACTRVVRRLAESRGSCVLSSIHEAVVGRRNLSNVEEGASAINCFGLRSGASHQNVCAALRCCELLL